jgi:hypothetical protein
MSPVEPLVSVDEGIRTVVIEESGGVKVVQVGLGVPGATGAPGPAGPTGPAGGQPVPVTIAFATPLSSWVTSHSFPYSPAVITKDGSGNVINGDVSYPDSTHVAVSWAGNETGIMELM